MVCGSCTVIVWLLFFLVSLVGYVILGYLLYYSRISIAHTSLGPWKFILDTGSSRLRGKIMIAAVKEANAGNLGMTLDWLPSN